jgi:hypothetical protein
LLEVQIAKPRKNLQDKEGKKGEKGRAKLESREF